MRGSRFSSSMRASSSASGSVGRITVERRAEAVVVTRLHFVAHVDFAGRIVADQHHREARLMAASGEGGGARGDVGAQGLGEGKAVDQFGSHGRSRWAVWEAGQGADACACRARWRFSTGMGRHVKSARRESGLSSAAKCDIIPALPGAPRTDSRLCGSATDVGRACLTWWDGCPVRTVVTACRLARAACVESRGSS